MGSPRQTIVLVLALLAGLLPLVLADVSSSQSGSDAALVNLTLRDVSVKDAIDKLFDGRGLKYRVEPGVTGKVVELTFKGITFDQALKAFAGAADLAWKVVDGVYVIGPAKSTKPDKASAQPKGGASVSKNADSSDSRPPASPAPVNTGNAVMVESGPVFYGNPGCDSGCGGGLYPVYPPVYQAGNISVVGGGWGNGPVVIAGSYGGQYGGVGYGGYLGGRSVYYPPPPGWVTPDMLIMLRNQWAFSPVRNYAPAWAY